MKELERILKEKFEVEIAKESDLEDILRLQKLAYISEAKIYNNFNIEPLKQTIEELHKEFKESLVLKKIENERLLGSVRAYAQNGSCYIGRLIVHPNVQNRGIGGILLKAIESCYKEKRFELFTGYLSKKNIEFYKKRGYKKFKTKKINEFEKLVYFEKISKE